MALPAEIRETQSADRRGAVRRTLQLSVDSQLGYGAFEAVIRDLSEYGLLVETAVDLALGDRLYVELPEAGIRAAVVVWRRGDLFGCEFPFPLTKKLVSATLLRAPSERTIEGDGDLSPPRDLLESGGRYETETDDSALLVLIVSLVVLLVATLLFLSALFLPSVR
ncbi:MAG: PilZ domain-containing protein [Sphingomicrobium sp.]